MKKKSNNPFASMQNAATGIAGLGLTTAVGAGIAHNAPAGSPSVTQGFNTLAGFSGVAATAVGGKAVLSVLPKKKKKSKLGY